MTGFPAERRRWFEAADFRHATLGPPVRIGDDVRTLCGELVVAIEPVPGFYAPQCPACDREWRAAENIPQREERMSSHNSPCSRPAEQRRERLTSRNGRTDKKEARVG